MAQQPNGTPAGLRAPAGEHLSFTTLSGYGTIQMGINAVSTCCLVHLLFFYTDVMHLNPSYAGLVMFIGQVWDGITDPLMGVFSDTRRWKRGRRRPFFIPGAILMSVFYAMLFMPPALEGLSLFAYMLVAYLAFCTGRTILDVPYNALAPDLTLHYDERSRLAGWRAGISVLGDMSGGLLPIAMLLALHTDAGGERFAYAVAAAVMAAIGIGGGIYGRWGTYERTDASLLPHDEQPWRGRIALLLPQGRPESWAPHRLLDWALGRMVRTILAPLWSLPAAILILTHSLVVVGTNFPYTTFRYVNKYYFQDESMDLFVMIAYQVTALCAAPFWIWLTRRIAKKHAYQAAIFGYLFSTLPVLFCRFDDRELFLAAMAACGFCGTGIWMVPDAIAPDVIEWHRLHRGRAQEGAFYGVWALIRKSAGGLTPWFVGLTLTFVGWVPDVVQSGRVLQAILAMFVLYPMIFLSLGAIVFTWFPISRGMYQDIRRQLEEREAV